MLTSFKTLFIWHYHWISPWDPGVEVKLVVESLVSLTQLSDFKELLIREIYHGTLRFFKNFHMITYWIFLLWQKMCNLKHKTYYLSHFLGSIR